MILGINNTANFSNTEKKNNKTEKQKDYFKIIEVMHNQRHINRKNIGKKNKPCEQK